MILKNIIVYVVAKNLMPITNEQKASQAIKLLKHYYDYDESFQELITDIDSYIGGLYLQNPEMDIDELRSYIKEFIPLRTEKNRRRV